MTLSDWHAWIDSGMDIGSHTRTHADLSVLDASQATKEIQDSRRELEQNL